MENVILKMKNIIKDFSGIKALNNVNIEVYENEIHAICGENGAGKSTLMKVLSGVYPYLTYQGEIEYNNKICKFKNIKDSEKEGIVIIHQELALIPELSIMENIFLGNEIQNNGIIDWNKCRKKAIDIMNTLGLNENPDELIKNIGVGKQQLVEIAKALAKNVKLLILDEPTAALNDSDSEKLLNLILKLKKENNMSSIIISHKLNEIKKVADRITIIRDGCTIETLDCRNDDITENRIIRGMVGRDIIDLYPTRIKNIGEKIFEIKDWNVYSEEIKDKKILDNININVKKGEVVGIAGLMGSGRTELARSIFGKSIGRNITGEIYLNNEKIEVNTVLDAIKNRIAYVTEDRKTLGLILNETINKNISLPSLYLKLSKYGVVDEHKELDNSLKFKDMLKIKSSSVYQKVSNLSGGNQQKVMLARWIYTEPDLLILDEPTRGVDVGAKFEIYLVINKLIEMGKSVILISSEMPEVIGLSDRIYVMNEGKIVGELEKNEISQENIMKCIMKVT